METAPSSAGGGDWGDWAGFQRRQDGGQGLVSYRPSRERPLFYAKVQGGCGKAWRVWRPAALGRLVNGEMYRRKLAEGGGRLDAVRDATSAGPWQHGGTAAWPKHFGCTCT